MATTYDPGTGLPIEIDDVEGDASTESKAQENKAFFKRPWMVVMMIVLGGFAVYLTVISVVVSKGVVEVSNDFNNSQAQPASEESRPQSDPAPAAKPSNNDTSHDLSGPASSAPKDVLEHHFRILLAADCLMQPELIDRLWYNLDTGEPGTAREIKQYIHESQRLGSSACLENWYSFKSGEVSGGEMLITFDWRSASPAGIYEMRLQQFGSDWKIIEGPTRT